MSTDDELLGTESVSASTSARGYARQIRGAESPRRVLQVLMAFDEQRPQATISELADVVGVPLSTCYRYVGLLREIGLLDEGERATYHVTPQIMRVARAAQASNKLSQVARPYLERISARVNETVLLMQVIGSVVVCVESIPSRHSIRFVFEAGHSLSLGTGASGKLLLALLPEHERSRFMAQRAAVEPAFAAAIPELEHDLPVVAHQGWATNQTGHEEGFWACAAAIRDGRRAVGAISVVGPEFRMAPHDLDEIRNELVEAAADISQARASLY